MRITGLGMLISLVMPGLLAGQTTPDSKAAFEVATIKRVLSAGFKADPESSVSVANGKLNMRNVSLREMVATAYGVKDHQLAGPDWMKSERYDVVAKAPSGVPMDSHLAMLRGLLADRFKLEVHRETKEMSISAMVVGKNGPKLGKAKPEGSPGIDIEGEKMLFLNYSMPKLADYLSQRTGGVPVIDETKLEGFYDFSVRVLDTPADNPMAVKRAIGMGSRDGTLARRIAEEIGLRLETRKGPGEVIVVDSVTRTPSEN